MREGGERGTGHYVIIKGQTHKPLQAIELFFPFLIFLSCCSLQFWYVSAKRVGKLPREPSVRGRGKAEPARALAPSPYHNGQSIYRVASATWGLQAPEVTLGPIPSLFTSSRSAPSRGGGGL